MLSFGAPCKGDSGIIMVSFYVCGFQISLACFERSGIQSIPGCSGEGISGKDYCYAPPTGELVRMGKNKSPASAFPLNECQGDCDRDTACDVSRDHVCSCCHISFLIFSEFPCSAESLSVGTGLFPA